MSRDIMISVKGLGKRFKIYTHPWKRAVEWASLGRITHHQAFWALRNISFEVERGECVGIIGPNGAGKTTLLKILTRALHPTEGEFEVRGNVLSLLELGTGFNLELTGRQNIHHSAQLLGFPDGYVSGMIDDIEAFAELGEFFDRPIKIYSSGMYVRLAFSMFVFMRPQILIVDEALSVGDVFFQQKSFAKMREMIAGGTTCLFASHDAAAIRNLCNRAVFLNNGHINFIGDPEEAISRYHGQLGDRPEPGEAITIASDEPSEFDDDHPVVDPADIVAHDVLGSRKNRHGAGGLEVVAARVVDSQGRDRLQVEMMNTLTVHMLLRAHQSITEPSAGIHLYDRLGNLVFAAGTRQLQHHLPPLEAGEELVISMTLQFNVQPGEYTFCLGASEPSSDGGPNVGYVHDRHEMLGPLVVTYDSDRLYPFYGIAKLPMTVQFHHVPRSRARID